MLGLFLYIYDYLVKNYKSSFVFVMIHWEDSYIDSPLDCIMCKAAGSNILVGALPVLRRYENPKLFLFSVTLITTYSTCFVVCVRVRIKTC